MKKNKLKVNLTIYTTKNALNYSKKFLQKPSAAREDFYRFFFIFYLITFYIYFLTSS